MPSRSGSPSAARTSPARKNRQRRPALLPETRRGMAQGSYAEDVMTKRGLVWAGGGLLACALLAAAGLGIRVALMSWRGTGPGRPSEDDPRLTFATPYRNVRPGVDYVG